MTLREEDRKQFNTKVVELEEVHSRIEMKENELTTIHVAQTKVAAEQEEFCTQNAS